MENIYIGEYIRRKRNDLKLSQSQVCDGICDPVTLSRIESGKQMPNRSHLNAILQRLGMPDTRYYALEGKNELEIEALKKEIIACNSFERADEGVQKLNSLEQLADKKDHLTQQFILRSKALLGLISGQINLSEQLELLLTAIRITVPRFDLNDFDSYLYTQDELKLIVSIANNYSDSGNNEKAADILYQLLKYIKKHYSEVITSGGILPLVIFNYARVLDLCGHFKMGMQVAQEGIQVCSNNGHYQYLYACLAIYAECCHFQNLDDKSAKAYRQAYVLCEFAGTQRALNAIAHEAKEYLNLDFFSENL